MTPQYVTRQELVEVLQELGRTFNHSTATRIACLNAAHRLTANAPPPPCRAPPQPAPAAQPGPYEELTRLVDAAYAGSLKIASELLAFRDRYHPADGPPFGIKPACAWILLRETPPLYECESCHRKIDADDQRPACNLYHWPVPDGGKP